jgi:hypothetical protein
MWTSLWSTTNASRAQGRVGMKQAVTPAECGIAMDTETSRLLTQSLGSRNAGAVIRPGIDELEVGQRRTGEVAEGSAAAPAPMATAPRVPAPLEDFCAPASRTPNDAGEATLPECLEGEGSRRAGGGPGRRWKWRALRRDLHVLLRRQMAARGPSSGPQWRIAAGPGRKNAVSSLLHGSRRRSERPPQLPVTERDRRFTCHLMRSVVATPDPRPAPLRFLLRTLRPAALS